MSTRVVEGKKPYTGGKAISIDENKVISLNLRDENNLIIYDSGDDEIYVDLQLDEEITPTSAFPIGVNTGRVIVDNGWDKAGTIICAKTTSGDNIKLFYADEGTLWIDNGTGTFKQIYFKADVDALLLALRNYIDGELAKKQNGVSSDTAPEDPVQGDLWYDTVNDVLKVYDGSQWNSTGGGSDIEYVTQAEYNALLPGALTDNKHYFIYTPDSPTPPTPWQPDVSRTIFYYEFENNLDDSSGNGHNITSSAGVGYSTVGGQQVLIATNNDSGLDVSPSWTSGIGSGDFAISFWLYPVQPDSLNYPMLVGISSNIFPYVGPNIFYDPFNNSSNGDCVYFRMRGGSQAYEHASTTTASSLYNSWHHIVMTRISGVVSCYIDGALETSWGIDTESFPTYDYAGHIFARSDYSYQTRGTTGAMTDKFILENVGWSQTEVEDYYNDTKGNYGIS